MLPTPPATPFELMAKNATFTVQAGAARTSFASAHEPALPIFGAMTPKARVKRRGDPGTISRALSDNELSYYLPSRGDGVNDMYVHHGVRALPHQLSHPRVRIAWALQLSRHPLLASAISMRGHDDVVFVHGPPTSVESALAAGDARLQYFGHEYGAPLDIVDAYLNGPRTLGNDMLACLIVRAGTRRTAHQSGAAGPTASTAQPADTLPAPVAEIETLSTTFRRPPENSFSHASSVLGLDLQPTLIQLPETAQSSLSTAQTTALPHNPNLGVAERGPEQLSDFEVMLCTTHYVGDGMALHTFMNELYALLGSALSDEELVARLEAEIEERAKASESQLPPSLEDRLGLSRLQTAVGDVAQRRADASLLGGQVLPLRKGRSRHTIVPTHAFSPEETKIALAKCKEHGVTIAHVVFALCAVAWNKECADRTQPTMIYSALNMRPHMPALTPSPSFFHLAVGYFNVVLPSLAPLPASELVWHRATQTKTQTLAAVKSPLAKAMFRSTASGRAARSQHWAIIDDAAAEKQARENPGLGLGIRLPEREAPVPEPPAPTKPSRTPPPPPAGQALMGVSMLGNLDGMYRRSDHGGIELFSLTTGSRQRPGGLLLFAYSLADKLWLSLGYDQNGFEDGAIERFWGDVLGLAREVLLA